MSAIVETNTYQVKTNMENKMKYKSQRLERIQNNKRQEKLVNVLILLTLLITYLIIIEHLVSLALD